MARRNRRKTLIPHAKPALEQLKRQVLINDGLIEPDTEESNIAHEVAKEIGIPFKKGYNGQLSTKNAGKIGGQIGGRMVKELVKMAQEQLAQKNQEKL
ncbi:small, acid-soluble spore protein, alpha/beta type [Tepidibacillus sp. LV47]|uniref:small, acid-soluble spore protein, alpha/beta type n=1 Tax=Tepidibacillus sp. LV47 TaxID=3398228 RepID=UPI003AAC9768